MLKDLTGGKYQMGVHMPSILQGLGDAKLQATHFLAQGIMIQLGRQNIYV